MRHGTGALQVNADCLALLVDANKALNHPPPRSYLTLPIKHCPLCTKHAAYLLPHELNQAPVLLRRNHLNLP